MYSQLKAVAEYKEFAGRSGRVLAEVLLGLLLADPTAYLHAEPAWQPALPAAEGLFQFTDLLLATSSVADSLVHFR